MTALFMCERGVTYLPLSSLKKGRCIILSKYILLRENNWEWPHSCFKIIIKITLTYTFLHQRNRSVVHPKTLCMFKCQQNPKSVPYIKCSCFLRGLRLLRLSSIINMDYAGWTFSSIKVLAEWFFSGGTEISRS